MAPSLCLLVALFLGTGGSADSVLSSETRVTPHWDTLWGGQRARGEHQEGKEGRARNVTA